MGKASRAKKERKKPALIVTDDMILDRIKRHVCTKCEEPTKNGAIWCRLCTHKCIERSRAKWRRPVIDKAFVLSILDAYEEAA